MPKTKNTKKKHIKISYDGFRKLEVEFLPLILLFGVVSGVLTLILILLIVYSDIF